MKWIGALLFISITTWIGFEWSNKLAKRPVHIRQLKNALKILEAEMLYSQLPLADAFRSISEQIPEPSRSFFHALSVEMDSPHIDLLFFWDKQVAQFIHSSALEKNEEEILKQFGRTLGRHDLSQQQKHIHLTTTFLERELQDARDRHVKFGGMAKMLGVLSGLFIVLMFI